MKTRRYRLVYTEVDRLWSAEYKWGFWWYPVSGSISRNGDSSKDAAHKHAQTAKASITIIDLGRLP